MDALNHDVINSDSGPGPAILTVVCRSMGPVCMLTLRGELNGTSIVALEAQIDQIGASNSDVVLLDLDELHRVDDVGRRVLVGLDYYVRALGGRLTVMGVDGQVAETLAGTQLDLEGRHDWSVDRMRTAVKITNMSNGPNIHQHEEA